MTAIIATTNFCVFALCMLNVSICRCSYVLRYHIQPRKLQQTQEGGRADNLVMMMMMMVTMTMTTRTMNDDTYYDKDEDKDEDGDDNANE